MIEKNGVPSVLLTALTAMGKVAGANRIVGSGLIPHTVGDPTRSPDDEFVWRKGQIQRALNAAATPIEEAQVFADW
jgi:glycine reductase